MEVQELITKRKELENSIYKLISDYVKETEGFLTKVDIDVVYEEYQGRVKSVVRIDVKVKTLI